MTANQPDLDEPGAMSPMEVSADVTMPESGLSTAQAAERLAEDGPNTLPGGQRRSLLSIAVGTMREPMFLLLLAAGTLYLAFGDLHRR